MTRKKWSYTGGWTINNLPDMPRQHVILTGSSTPNSLNNPPPAILREKRTAYAVSQGIVTSTTTGPPIQPYVAPLTVYAGDFNSTITYENGNTHTHAGKNYSSWLALYETPGTASWDAWIEAGVGETQLFDILLTQEGVYATGFWDDDDLVVHDAQGVTASITPDVAGTRNAWLTKFDLDGNVQWLKAILPQSTSQFSRAAAGQGITLLGGYVAVTAWVEVTNGRSYILGKGEAGQTTLTWDSSEVTPNGGTEEQVMVALFDKTTGEFVRAAKMFDSTATNRTANSIQQLPYSTHWNGFAKSGEITFSPYITIGGSSTRVSAMKDTGSVVQESKTYNQDSGNYWGVLGRFNSDLKPVAATWITNTTNFNAFGLGSSLADGDVIYCLQVAADVTMQDDDGSTQVFSLSAGSTEDLKVIKVDSTGSYVWSKTVEDGWQTISAIWSHPESDYFYVCGKFDMTATFGPGETNETTLIPTGSEGYIAKYLLSDGTLEWVTKFGGNATFPYLNISQDSVSGSIKLGCTYETGTAIFGDGEANEISFPVVGTTRTPLNIYFDPSDGSVVSGNRIISTGSSGQVTMKSSTDMYHEEF